MAVRPIVLYPDPVLLRPTRIVTEVDDEIRQLVADMADTLRAAPGIGLAANQIGVDLRVFLVDLSAGEDPDQWRVFINPQVDCLGAREVGEEGCLSFPDITVDVERSREVEVTALDLEGRSFSFRGEQLTARVIQHELEHLDGQTFLRDLSPLKRELVKKKIRKRIKAGDWVAMADS